MAAVHRSRATAATELCVATASDIITGCGAGQTARSLERGEH